MRIHIGRHGADYPKGTWVFGCFWCLEQWLADCIPYKVDANEQCKATHFRQNCPLPRRDIISFMLLIIFPEEALASRACFPFFEDERIHVKSTVPLFFLALFYIKMCCLELSPQRLWRAIPNCWETGQFLLALEQQKHDTLLCIWNSKKRIWCLFSLPRGSILCCWIFFKHIYMYINIYMYYN